MRVLFVPLPQGSLPHLLPLLALKKRIGDPSIETAFLVPARFHKLLRQIGVEVLEMDYNNRGAFDSLFRTELMAYYKYSPDVVVDDTNPPTSFASELYGVGRISMYRYGMFPGSEPGPGSFPSANEFFRFDIGDFPDVTHLGLTQPRSRLDFFRTDFKVIPGIKSIEAPPAVADDPSYHFAGPLLMDDFLVNQSGEVDLENSGKFDALKAFCDLHSGRRIVFATFGTTAKARPQMLDCLRFLLESDIAVITSIKVEGLSLEQQQLYYYAAWLPLHFVCSRVDLMVHQCGTGTYQYPLIHRVPGITIGTQIYEMEMIARRLEELGVSVHLPSPDICDDFLDRFKQSIDKYFSGNTDVLERARRNLIPINEEIKRTTESFDIDALLGRAAAHTQKKPGGSKRASRSSTPASSRGPRGG